MRLEVNSKELNGSSQKQGEDLISFRGRGLDEVVLLPADQFLFAKSQDNYVELHYLMDDRVARRLIRIPLQELSESFEDPYLHRCHRSYLVNLRQVLSVQGGLSDMLLTLERADVAVPVSKTYAKETLTTIGRLKHGKH